MSNSRLSRIETLWSVVRHSQDTDSELSVSAQQQLLNLYGSAIKRYLLAALRDQDAADELFQQFALKFVEGGFRNADESKGQFRAFVKTVLYRMIASHFRKRSRSKQKTLQPDLINDWVVNESENDSQFSTEWRDEILEQAWQALENNDRQSKTNHFIILTVKVNEPGLSSPEFAERLTELLGKPVKATAARVSLHRAREKFAKYVIESVAQSLENPTRQNIEEELIDLELISYCRDTLATTHPA